MLAAVAASTSPFGSSFTLQLINLGFVGAVLIDIGASHKFLVTRWSVEREIAAIRAGYEAQLALYNIRIIGIEEDKKELKVSNTLLNSVLQDKAIPALVSTGEIAQEYVRELARRNDGRRRESDS